ncbi:hypothetical protein PIB30_108273, partial [Stylosanthes scabra]|nr:hypothetical protein [Stylosanthes scabra]
MRLTLHPRLNATTTSPHVPCLPRFTPHPQPTTHAYAYNPTHMRGSTLTTSPTYPRICVTSNAYAWPTHPLPHSTLFLSITPMHMRTTLRICVGGWGKRKWLGAVVNGRSTPKNLMLRNPFGNPEDYRQVHRIVS